MQAVNFHHERVERNKIKLAKKLRKIENQVNSKRIFDKIKNYLEFFVKNKEKKHDIRREKCFKKEFREHGISD